MSDRVWCVSVCGEGASTTPPHPLPQCHQMRNRMELRPDVLHTHRTHQQGTKLPNQRPASGHFHHTIPADMWKRRAPTNWARGATRTPPVGATKGEAVTALASPMATDGLLTRLPDRLPPNARAFAKRKSTTNEGFHRGR